MTEQSQTRIGSVAQEAARLIDDMATMARSRSSRGPDPSRYAGRPAQEPVSPDAPPDVKLAADTAAADTPAGTPTDAPTDTSSRGPCSHCGGERVGAPEACRLCPLCQGIALLRSVRPEVVDQLADLASVVAECLRDVAAKSRASSSAPTVWPASGRSSDSGPTTQDIPVEDESEG